NERVAVVQTPYASVPGAASMVERVAGATTDVQLMSHQGAKLFGAGSWVGASDLVRPGALEAIVQTVTDSGHPVLVCVLEPGHNGSRALQLFRAMALNAMLLPINLAGAINSLRQLWSGRKIPFQRTPKLQGRTAAAPVQIAAQFGLLLFAAAEAKIRYAAGE